MRRLTHSAYCSKSCQLADRLGVVLVDLSPDEPVREVPLGGQNSLPSALLSQVGSAVKSERMSRGAFVTSLAVAAGLPLRGWMSQKLAAAPRWVAGTVRGELRPSDPASLSHWRTSGGQPAWTVDGEFLRPSGLSLFTPSAEARDGSISLKVAIDRGAAGIVVRATDFANRYLIRLIQEGEEQAPVLTVRASLVRDGVETVIHEQPSHQNLPGFRSLFDWTVKMEGDFFCALIDGSPLTSWRHAALPKGSVGVMSGTGDSFRVYSGTIRVS